MPQPINPITATDLIDALLRDGAWVPLERYCELYGETREAVTTRRSKAVEWIDGVHSKFVKGSGIWVNLLAVNQWVAKSELRPACRSGRRRKVLPPSGSPSSTAGGSAGNLSD